MRIRSLLVSLGVSAASVLGLPHQARAQEWHRHGHDRWDGIPTAAFHRAYAILKGGGMALRGDDGPAGSYFGLEVGQSTADRLDLGVSVDWFHHRSRDLELLFETENGFQPPLRGEITRFESSSDFVPLGFTARLRLPLQKSALVPFVSGTLAYEILHVEFYSHESTPGKIAVLLGNSQTLMGFGWQAAGGVELALAPGLGIVGEAGFHSSDPSRELDSGGDPVDVRTSLHGGFVRAGLRLAL